MGLTLKGRTIIAKRWADGDSATEIAKGLGFASGTIYAELARGHTGQLDRNSRPQYDPARGQAAYDARRFLCSGEILRLRIFKEYTEGVPMQKICDSLNNAGQKTVRGNRFTANSLRNFLVTKRGTGKSGAPYRLHVPAGG